MNITTRTKQIIAAVAVTAAVGVAAGGAFTASGLTNAAPSQFIGGTVTQNVTGATLSGVVYSFVDGSNTSIDGITLAFSDGAADGITPTATPTGGTGGTFACGTIAAGTSACDFVPTLAETGYTGLSSLAITVGS